jgi:beta-lactamase superfamily II metal-dependent hydrolase
MDVGQGSANFVQYFDSDAPNAIAKNAGLIDVGSEGWRNEAGKPSARLIVQELLKMNPKWTELQEVLLSHSDSDHHNLIEIVLNGFHVPSSGKSPNLEVHRTWYGGEYALYQKGEEKNVLARLLKYRPINSRRRDVQRMLPAPWSSFDDPDPNNWAPLAKIGGIELWVLAANTTGAVVNGAKKPKYSLKDNGSGFAINTKSLIVAAKFGGISIIATGDATGLTLAHAVNVLKNPLVKAKLGTVFMITAPHHGSDTTTYSLNGSNSALGLRLGKAVVKQFVDDLAPQTVTASAGQRGNFGHPSVEVLEDFSGHLLGAPKFIDPVLAAMGFNQHFYTAYFEAKSLNWTPLPPIQPPSKKQKTSGKGKSPKWPDGDGWWVARTAENVFTTDYFWTHVEDRIPIAFPPNAAETPADLVYDTPHDPPSAISWAFDVTDTGATTVSVAFRRDGLHPLHIAQVEAMLGGPLPDDEFIWVPSAELVTQAEETDEQPPSDQPADNDAVPASAPRPQPPGLRNARQIS